MTDRTYYAPTGGLPPQTQLLTDRAVFTEAYAVIPKGVMSDIVTSYLPFWENTRLWVLSRPLSGFAETFSQYIMEVAPGGGSDRPEPDAGAEGALFVVEGEVAVTLSGKTGSPYYWNYILAFPPDMRGEWEMRATRTNGPSIDTITDDIYWSSYTERIEDKVFYQHSALCGLIFDAHDFSSLPQRVYDVVGLVISIPSNYEPLGGTYAGEWDGTFVQAWTDNPAFILYDIITNNRYGLGQFLQRNDSHLNSLLYRQLDYMDAVVPLDLAGTLAPTTPRASPSTGSRSARASPAARRPPARPTSPARR